MTRHRFLLTLAALAAAASLAAADRPPVNVDRDGLALKGYDPVAFFTLKAPVKGRPEFSSEHHGARYQFHSAKSKATFDANPDRYEPEFGGYCAYGVSRGKLVGIDPEAFQIVGERLLLQYSKGVRDDFNKDPEGNLRKAREQWPRLSSSTPK